MERIIRDHQKSTEEFHRTMASLNSPRVQLPQPSQQRNTENDSIDPLAKLVFVGLGLLTLSWIAKNIKM